MTGAGRFVLIVLDGVGIGEAPDAEYYGDRGSNTLGNVADTDCPETQERPLAYF